MMYAKILAKGDVTTTYAAERDIALNETLLRDGFLPFEREEEPEDVVDGLGGYELLYRQDKDHIVGYYVAIERDPQKIEARIATLKEELAATDYKVVKNQELQMLGQACAYDPEALHAEREPIRVAIRELEGYVA